MLKYNLCICGLASLLFTTNVQGHCKDIDSQIVSQGLHYVPGPDRCVLCICDNGNPKWCKSVLCSQPQNCKSFQVGNSCCEFTCLDDILTASDNYKETYDLALRLVASVVTAILSLSLLFFLLHRLKRRKLQIRQNRRITEDQRSLNSIGYIAGSLGYLSGNIGYLGAGNSELEFRYEEATAHESLCKPPGNFFPRDEAPPPYEEAVRSAQTEEISNAQVRTLNNSLSVITSAHQQQQSMPSILQCRHEFAINSFYNNHHEYSNVSVPNIAVLYQNYTNIKHENAAGSASATVQVLQDRNSRNEKSKSYENVLIHSENPSCSNRQKVEVCRNQAHRPKSECTSSKGHMRKHEAKDSKTLGYENIKHRTIPNISDGRIRESIQRPNDMQRLRFADRSDTNIKSLITLKDCREMPLHCTLPKNLRDLGICDLPLQSTDVIYRSHPKQGTKTSISTTESNLSDVAHTSSSGTCPRPSCSEVKVETARNKLAAKNEKHSFISYQYLSSEDDDDYRSECENCKSSGLTILDDEETDILNETMTLQRRPLEPGEEVPYYRTSLTLPTNTKKPRAVIQNPGREGWFVAMQETSSSDNSD